MNDEGQRLGSAPYPRTTDMVEMARRCHSDTLAFYRYWLGKAGERAMPSRADLDPIEMKRFLSCLQLVDVIPDSGRNPPWQLVYRLVGESEVKVHGFNPTGRPVAECAIGKESSDPMGNYNIVVADGQPVYDWSRITHPGGFLVSQECILLPLSDDGRTVNMVVTYGKVVPTYPVAGRKR
ncbi:MAG: PAS domain-containing protein [Rhodospirillaceae bacterium]|nr:PAS domain-containing protein [Rhodospirillaceae bacterium]